MAFRIFTISIQNSAQGEAELNGFLQSHKILSVDRRWVEQGASSFWCFCVDYLDKPQQDGSAFGANAARPKIDNKDVLTPEQFVVFAKLRDLRKEIAQSEAVPVYTVFTNEQLAQMVQTKAITKAALEKIDGVGDARIEKCGARVLDLLTRTWPTGNETSGKPV